MTRHGSLLTFFCGSLGQRTAQLSVTAFKPRVIDSGGQQSRSTNVPRRYPNGSFHKELPRPRRTELCVLDMTRKHGQRVAL